MRNQILSPKGRLPKPKGKALQRIRRMDLIQIHGVKMTPVGLIINHEEITWDSWRRCKANLDEWLRMASKLDQSVQFSLGDLLLYGEERWKDAFFQELDEKGYSYGTMHNWMYVSKHVPIERRYEELSWAHHRMVAAMSEEDQELFLQAAVRGSMTTADFAHYIDIELSRRILAELPREEAEQWDQWRRMFGRSWKQLDDMVGRGLLEKAMQEVAEKGVPDFPDWWKTYRPDDKKPAQIAREAWAAAMARANQTLGRRAKGGQ